MIVKVQYFNPVTKKYFGRDYSYFSEDTLQVGDVVTVPVKDGTGRAKVSAVNVPESEIEAFKDKVKTIPSNSIVKPQTLVEAIELAEPGIIHEAKVEFKLFDDPKPQESIISQAEKVVEQTQTEAIQETLSQVDPMGTIATVKISPEINTEFLNLRTQVEGLAKYAASRIIKSLEDIKAANDDIILISKVSNAVEDLRKSYTQPLNDHIKAINLTFKQLSEPLEMADKITDDKILAYRRDVIKKQQEAEAINRQKGELARREAEFNGTGEVTINTEPVIVPEVPKTVKTESGTLGIRKIRKARVVDFSKLPDNYKLPNQRLLDTAASTGVQAIAGVEFYIDEQVTHRSR